MASRWSRAEAVRVVGRGGTEAYFGGISNRKC